MLSYRAHCMRPPSSFVSFSELVNVYDIDVEIQFIAFTRCTFIYQICY